MGRGRPKKGTKVIPLQFDVAEEVEEISKQLLSTYHSHLVNSKIAYLFCNKEITKSGKKVAATAEKTSKKVKALCGIDFVMTVSYPIWRDMEDRMRIAICDHELNHMLTSTTDEGDTKHQIIPHDFSDFNNILQRHGLYRGELEIMGSVVGDLENKDEISSSDDLDVE